MGNLPPGDGMPGGPMPPAFFQPFMSPRYPGGPRPPLRMPNQPPVGVPGSQPLLPSAMDPAARPQGHPGMGGPMQRMNPPRGMAGMAPQAGALPCPADLLPSLQTFGSGMRPPPSSLPGPGMPAMNMGPGGRGPWPNPNANSIAYSSSSPGNYVFPMGPGSEGPMGGMSAMEPHHMNGSLGSGDMDGLPKSSPSNLGALSNPPGTPRDEAELSSSFLNPFQSDSYSPSMTMSV
ncbi:single-stranded DNA-binding protein 4 isoform X28 [Indicator indicator]|uniref:single-stranded DNA-binding protein 4 isoform X28 n=1 Tax=Indicator indicator TaxID=1002788 RepID=UPI0023DF1BA1|nr:single-stranded DNA-binding protein 4 isoform X28 [Indicator indicator]